MKHFILSTYDWSATIIKELKEIKKERKRKMLYKLIQTAGFLFTSKIDFYAGTLYSPLLLCILQLQVIMHCDLTSCDLRLKCSIKFYLINIILYQLSSAILGGFSEWLGHTNRPKI